MSDYLSDDRSHVELIREDFARSRARSVMRHNEHVVARPILSVSTILPGVAVGLVAALILLILKAAS